MASRMRAARDRFSFFDNSSSAWIWVSPRSTNVRMARPRYMISAIYINSAKTPAQTIAILQRTNAHLGSGEQVSNYESEGADVRDADPINTTKDRKPYAGITFATIPEIQAIGNFTGQQ